MMQMLTNQASLATHLIYPQLNYRNYPTSSLVPLSGSEVS